MRNDPLPFAGKQHPPPALRTFIVEDSPLIRETLTSTLQELTPVRVVGTAEDEAAAVQALTSAEGVDLAIVDIFLARGSGLGVLRAVREAGAAIDCVVLSNYVSEDMRRQCLQLGAVKVFDKSGEIDALLSFCEQRALGHDRALR